MYRVMKIQTFVQFVVNNSASLWTAFLLKYWSVCVCVCVAETAIRKAAQDDDAAFDADQQQQQQQVPAANQNHVQHHDNRQGTTFTNHTSIACS